MKTKFCINCHKQISRKTKRYCPKCYHIWQKEYQKDPKNNSNYKDGRSLKDYFCIDCGTRINWQTATIGKQRCRKCSGTESRGKLAGRKNPMFGKISHAKRIVYKNILFRSSWEVMYAEWLDSRNIKWQYEPKTFDLGDCTYTPDFYLPETDEYIEIKGYFPNKTLYKLNKFSLLYPKIKFIIIMEAQFKMGLYNTEADLVQV